MSAVVIIGAGDIGQALANQLSLEHPVIIASRTKPDCASNKFIPLDLSDNHCYQSISDAVNEAEVGCIINTVGLLHDNHHRPEKSITQFDESWFFESMRVNCVSNLALLSSLTNVLPRQKKISYIAFSARVGSISDNKLGGWVSYRASKAALNMVIKTVALEWQRRLPLATVIGYHPGTVATKLSKPFLNQTVQCFTPNQAATYLLALLTKLTPTMSGNVYDWKHEVLSF